MNINKGLENASEREIETNHDQIVDSFDVMDIKPELLRGIYAYGFECPFAIQQRAILPTLKGRDVIAQAQSGAGKTVTFSISVLQRIDPSIQQCQALILTPTRGCALQIQNIIMSIGAFLNINCYACVGGTNMQENIKALQDDPQIVVGTPGRVQDAIQRQALKTDAIKMFILDKADEMLARGFTEHIHTIFQRLPPSIQVILFSTTMPQDVLEITTKIIRDPIRFLLKTENPSLENVKQFYTAVKGEESKLDTVSDLVKTITAAQIIIFCNLRRTVEELAAKLSTRGFTLPFMHGDMDAISRAEIIKEFRSGSSRVLILTDLLARGIDTDTRQASLVINYDLPADHEKYLHRVSRKGVTINFITDDEALTMHGIEKFYNAQIEEMPMSVADLI